MCNGKLSVCRMLCTHCILKLDLLKNDCVLIKKKNSIKKIKSSKLSQVCKEAESEWLLDFSEEIRKNLVLYGYFLLLND